MHLRDFLTHQSRGIRERAGFAQQFACGTYTDGGANNLLFVCVFHAECLSGEPYLLEQYEVLEYLNGRVGTQFINLTWPATLPEFSGHLSPADAGCDSCSAKNTLHQLLLPLGTGFDAGGFCPPAGSAGTRGCAGLVS